MTKKKFVFVLMTFTATLFLLSPVFASETDGTINSSNKYAWGSKTGFINFGATNGNIHITDTAITGYAWNELYGWIHMNPTNGGVQNTTAGVLSGYAWNENLGYVNFSGVTINSSGKFTGQATGNTNTGVINFDCTNCSVKTDWRPASARSTSGTTETSGASGGGGGGLPPEAYVGPTSPTSVTINNGTLETTSSFVTIYLKGGSDTAYAWVSEDAQLINNALRVDLSPPTYASSVVYALSSGDGQKIVYTKFCTAWGRCGDLQFVTITYHQPPLVVEALPVPQLPSATLSKLPPVVVPPPTTVTQVIQGMLSRLITNVRLGFSKLLRGGLPVEKTIPIEHFVVKQTPLAFQGNWPLVDPAIVNRFVFAPLPKEFLALKNQFPELGHTLARVGVNRLSDVGKLQSVQMYLPGLTKAVGLAPTGKLPVGAYGQTKAIPLAELPQNIKDKIPSDVIFARAAGQLVDFKVALSLTNKGKPEQKIATISGRPLELTIRPDKPVTSVKGYLVFRSRTPQAHIEVSLKELLSSLVFGEPAFAYAEQQPVNVEEKLVLMEFDYTDPDDDGIYTANLQAPVPSGEYEVVTVLNYVDPTEGAKQIRLITVVDPEGYIYEKIDGKELRIPGAIATLHYLNPQTKQYEQWPAKEFEQVNPQVTDVRGSYSFLVPSGSYYLTVEAPGYESYEGKPFLVEEGNGVHTNIELHTKYWWFKMVDWKTALLIVVALLLLLNFYKDKKRDILNNISNS